MRNARKEQIDPTTEAVMLQRGFADQGFEPDAEILLLIGALSALSFESSVESIRKGLLDALAYYDKQSGHHLREAFLSMRLDSKIK
jgi:hypothetical protein